MHEALANDAGSPELMMLGAAMLGMPAFMMGKAPQTHTEAQYQKELWEKQMKAQQAKIQKHIDTAAMRWNGEQWTLYGEPIPAPKPPKQTRSEKKAEQHEKELRRRRALLLTDLRVIDRTEYRKNEHAADRQVREDMEYLGLNR